jgi:RES domain-containing protein
MARQRAAIYKMLHPEGLDASAFASLFDEELDTAFTADQVCCDSCYPDYAKRWPGLATAVQSESYPLDLFFENSCFPEFYSKTEFLEKCREMGCPICGAPLEHNLWTYTPRFEISPELEFEIAELEALATRTPFLTLLNPLAKRVHDEIKDLAANTLAKEFTAPLIRAREITAAHAPSQFLPPPAAICREGRYNHAGRPVLYLASDSRVAHAEIGQPATGCLVSSLTLKSQLKLLNLAATDLSSDLLQAISVSSLLSAPAISEGWDKPEYSFSRFVADCCVNLGFSAIQYPSVARDGGYNLVVFPQDGGWENVVAVGEIKEFRPAS